MKKYPSLSNKTKLRKIENFAVFDIEAKNWTQFVVAGVYDGSEFKHFDSLGDVLRYLESRKIEKVFAHFGGKYDFLFLLDFIDKHGKNEFVFEKAIPRGSGLLMFDVVCAKSSHKITFTDSSALLPFSLDSLTKSFGVAHLKKKYDYEKMPDKADAELLTYLEYDCKGLYEVLRKFYSWDMFDDASHAITTASQTLNVFSKKLQDGYSIRSLSSFEDAFVRQSYFGGRTEIFKPLFVGGGDKKISCYDVNSLYPSVMLEPMPTNPKRWVSTIIDGAMGFYECEVFVPDMFIPPLGVRALLPSGKKLIFPTGIIKGVFSSIELENAVKHGCKIMRVKKGLIFENAGPIFKDYILSLYQRRLEAKKMGDGVSDVLSKLMMNSLYGRFGLRVDNREILVSKPDEKDYYVDIVWSKESGLTMYKKKTEISSFNNVAISAWITSLARVKMYESLVSCDCYYTDTDSLFTTDKLKESNKLGELKHEYSAESACFLLPKTYIVQGKDLKKVVMKGFDKKKAQSFDLKDFEVALEGDLKRLKIENPAKFSSFKLSLSKGEIVRMKEAEERVIRSRYDKRIVEKIGSEWFTRPHKVMYNELVNS